MNSPTNKVCSAHSFKAKFQFPLIDNSISECLITCRSSTYFRCIIFESTQSHFFICPFCSSCDPIVELIFSFGIHQQYIRITKKIPIDITFIYSCTLFFFPCNTKFTDTHTRISTHLACIIGSYTIVTKCNVTANISFFEIIPVGR